MIERNFILRSEEIRQRAAEFVSALPLTEKPWQVSIRQYKTRRSLDANSYYWLRMAEIAMQTNNDKESVHEFFKSEFLVPIVVDMMTKSVTVSGSTTKLSVAEMADYTTKVEAWAVNNGIRLSEMKRT